MGQNFVLVRFLPYLVQFLSLPNEFGDETLKLVASVCMSGWMDVCEENANFFD